MNNSQILDILSGLSAEAFAYFFPGLKRPEPTKVPDLEPKALEEPASYKAGLDLDMECCCERRTGSTGRMARRLEIDLKGLFCEESDSVTSEQQLDAKTQALLDEIKALQEKYGVTIDEFEAVLSYTVKLSRLRITRRHQIILEDFDRREVKMDTLTKAVFLLYLDHPEGIRFKDLADHRSELERIYMSLSGRSDLQAMQKSLDDLTNSVMSNSISEKVSKVKKAFKNVVDERVARFYYIDGKAGEPKKIAFDRSLVIRD